MIKSELWSQHLFCWRFYKKLGIVMRLTAIIILAACLQVSARSYSQKVNLNLKKASLKSAFRTIRQQTGYSFLWNQDLLNGAAPITVELENADIREAMDACLKKAALTYDIQGKVIYIKSRPAPARVEEAAAMSGQALQQQINGQVVDSTGKPVTGATVMVKGTKKGVFTDADGRYHIEASEGQVLRFSYVGYIDQEVTIGTNTQINVTLKGQPSTLNDLVVVGYGTQKEEKLLGAIQSVKPSQLVATSSNLSTAFAGNVAGIVARQSSGEPGYDGATFYIRGIQTFGSNKGPLIIMDGVEISNSMMNNIPVDAIESVSILKDATATALYGSRGANGVIIITTKSGSNSEKMKIDARVENTISMPTFVPEIASGVDYMTTYNEGVKNSTPAGQPYSPFYSDEKIQGTKNHLNKYIFPDNDWYHMLFKDFTMNQNVNFNMTGGTKLVNYFLNFTFFNENGIIKKPSEGTYDVNLSNQKYLFQSNVDAALTKTTKVSLKMNTQLWYNNRPNEDISNLFYYSMRANPVRFPAVLPPGEGDTYVRYGNNNSWDTGPIDLNPYALLSEGYAKRYYSWLTSVLTVDQDLKGITKGLSAKVLASFYNYTYSGRYRFFTPYYFKVGEDYTVGEDGSYDYTTESIGTVGSTYLTSTVTRDGYHEYSLQGLINYQRSFGRHNVGAMAVYRVDEKVLNTPSADETDILPFREQGVAGRVTYDYDSRYLVEGNFGYNGSENFIKGKRFGFFPSLAVGYIISNESYFESLKNTINFLKFRVSYGLAGNDVLPIRFPYITTVAMDQSLNFYHGLNYTTAKGPVISEYGNEDATWEVAKKWNIGFDLKLLNAFSLSVDGFYEKRSGIFMQRESLPTSAGLAGNIPYANIGKVSNRGLDLTASYEKQMGKDFRLSFRGTFTYAHNEVEDKDEPKLLYAYTSAVGHPISTVFGYVAEGLFSSQQEIDNSPEQTFDTYYPGNIKYKDLNNDGQIDGNDVTAIGYPTTPEIMYGFNTGIAYKKWDMSFLIQGDARVSLLMSNFHPFADASHFGYGILQWIVDDHWSEENQNVNAAYPRLSSTWSVNDTKTSSFWVRDASYIRLKNFELGYRANKNVRVYAAGSNLFYLSPFKYWDPEMGSGNGLKYPLQWTVKIGAQLNF